MPSQYTVPQFIDIEDKVLGPVTVRQFVVLIIGTGLMVAAYSVFYKALGQTFLFVILGIMILAATVAFAFLRVNGRPFHLFLLSFLLSLKNPGLRVWDNHYVEPKTADLTPPPVAAIPTKAPLSPERLSKLALLVDTGGVFSDQTTAEWTDVPSAKKPTDGPQPNHPQPHGQ